MANRFEFKFIRIMNKLTNQCDGVQHGQRSTVFASVNGTALKKTQQKVCRDAPNYIGINPDNSRQRSISRELKSENSVENEFQFGHDDRSKFSSDYNEMFEGGFGEQSSLDDNDETAIAQIESKLQEPPSGAASLDARPVGSSELDNIHTQSKHSQASSRVVMQRSGLTEQMNQASRDARPSTLPSHLPLGSRPNYHSGHGGNGKLTLGSNSNSTATMTVATALSLQNHQHNHPAYSNDRQSSLPPSSTTPASVSNVLTSAKMMPSHPGQFMSSRASAQHKSPADAVSAAVGGKTPQIMLPSLMQNTMGSVPSSSQGLTGTNVMLHPQTSQSSRSMGGLGSLTHQHQRGTPKTTQETSQYIVVDPYQNASFGHTAAKVLGPAARVTTTAPASFSGTGYVAPGEERDALKLHQEPTSSGRKAIFSCKNPQPKGSTLLQQNGSLIAEFEAKANISVEVLESAAEVGSAQKRRQASASGLLSTPLFFNGNNQTEATPDVNALSQQRVAGQQVSLTSKKSSMPLIGPQGQKAPGPAQHSRNSTNNTESLPTLSPNRQGAAEGSCQPTPHQNAMSGVQSTLKKPAGLQQSPPMGRARLVAGSAESVSSKMDGTSAPWRRGFLGATAVVGTSGDTAAVLEKHHQVAARSATAQSSDKTAKNRGATATGTPAALPATGGLMRQQVATERATVPSIAPKQHDEQFSFQFVKIQLRQSKKDDKEETHKEVLLERAWLKKHGNRAIPHFSQVISQIKESEGVEITMNCNADAFMWIIDLVKLHTNYWDEYGTPEQREMYSFLPENEKEIIVANRFERIDKHNCLNKLVTSHFLQITWVYEAIWSKYFKEHFTEVINSCKISLSNLNSDIVSHVAKRVTDEQLERLKERRDKFLSNLYRARIEQKLLVNCQSKKQLLINEQSLFHCEFCDQLMTLRQSQLLSCAKNPNQTTAPAPGNTTDIDKNALRSFFDQDGQLYYGHSFSDLSLQLQRVNYDSERVMASNCCAQPVDLAQFIRFFRERFRLCWKEIYLKFAAVSKCYLPERCTDCGQYFALRDYAMCKKTVNYESLALETCTFHTIDPASSFNKLTTQNILDFKRQIQVIDETLNEEQCERFMERHPEIKYVEPQSMNFSQKIADAYNQYLKAQSEKGAHKPKDQTYRNQLLAYGLPVLEEEFEDLLFSSARAQPTLVKLLKPNSALETSDVIKRFTKEAKAYVRDHPLNNQKKEDAYTTEMAEALALAGANANDGGSMPSANPKRKLSPRSQGRVQRIVRKRLGEFRRDIVVEDDGKAMKNLANVLVAMRAEKSDKNEKKADKREVKDKSYLLEDNSGKETNLFNADIKILKKGKDVSKKQVMSDLSQIYSRKKKKDTVKASTTAMGHSSINAAKDSVPKPPANPSFAKQDKDMSQRLVPNQKQTQREQTAPGASTSTAAHSHVQNGSTGYNRSNSTSNSMTFSSMTQQQQASYRAGYSNAPQMPLPPNGSAHVGIRATSLTTAGASGATNSTIEGRPVPLAQQQFMFFEKGSSIGAVTTPAAQPQTVNAQQASRNVPPYASQHNVQMQHERWNENARGAARKQNVKSTDHVVMDVARNQSQNQPVTFQQTLMQAANNGTSVNLPYQQFMMRNQTAALNQSATGRPPIGGNQYKFGNTTQNGTKLNSQAPSTVPSRIQNSGRGVLQSKLINHQMPVTLANSTAVATAPSLLGAQFQSKQMQHVAGRKSPQMPPHNNNTLFKMINQR